MKKMKTLTVGADTYQVWDPEAARIDDTSVTENAWSSKNIVDRLCPSFTEGGAAVVCNPVEGYPLSVVSHINGETDRAILYMGGKNLLDITALTNWAEDRVESPQKETNAITITTSAQGRSEWGGRFSVPKALLGKTLVLSFGEWHSTDAEANPMFFVQFVDTAGTVIGERGFFPKKANSMTISVPQNIAHLMIYFRVDQDPPYSPVGTVLTVKDIQLEIGDEATAYQPFAEGRFFTAEFGRTVTGGVYDWSSGVLTDESGETVQLTPYKLAALPGDNVLYSDTGDTTVTGRSDIRSILESLRIR